MACAPGRGRLAFQLAIICCISAVKSPSGRRLAMLMAIRRWPAPLRSWQHRARQPPRHARPPTAARQEHPSSRQVRRPLCPAMGRSVPVIAAAGSVPSDSRRHPAPSHRGWPAPPPSPDRSCRGDGRMGESRTKGASRPVGAAQLCGLLPISFSAPPSAGWPAGIAGKKADHARLGKLAGEEHGGAEMARIADADGGDAVTRGALGCQIDSMLRHPLADAVRAVESQQRAGVPRVTAGWEPVFVTPPSNRAPYQNRRMIRARNGPTDRPPPASR